MKRSTACFLLTVAGLVVSAVLYAQDPTREGPGGPAGAFGADAETVTDGSPADTSLLEAARRQRDQAARKVQELQQRAGDFKEDAQFENVARADLSELFDRDLEYRQQQLELLGKRIERDGVQLDKRQSARDDLIELQLRSFQFDARGLGLTSSLRSARGPVVSERYSEPSSPSVGEYAPPSVDVAPARTVQTAAAAPARYGTVAAAPSRYGPEDSATDPRSDALARIRRARQALAKSEDADDKGRVLEDLKSALGDYFDADIQVRRQELDSVRQQLTDLESKLKQRADAKGEIVELHLKMIVNEANGLGFFGSRRSESGDRWSPAVYPLLYPN